MWMCSLAVMFGPCFHITFVCERFGLLYRQCVRRTNIRGGAPSSHQYMLDALTCLGEVALAAD